jgi:hypothetical protein
MEMNGHFCTLTTLILGKNPWYYLDRRLDRLQSLSAHFGKREKFLASSGNQTTIPLLTSL